jgi:Tol biopolymer transport system component/DNA-binding winged helix-turn-helix (wHTH) protein
MASPAQPFSVLRFGSFELDPENGELRKAGVSLKIHPQPFRLLLLLAERPGQIVPREEIRNCLWGENTFVDFERGINFCVNQIRATLGDDAEKPRYIETLPRRGYRFIAAVSNQDHRQPAAKSFADQSLSLPPQKRAEVETSVARAPRLQAVARQQDAAQWQKRAIAGVLTMFAISLAVLWFVRRQPPSLRNLEVTQLTANSIDNPVTSSAISPDGKYLAFTDHMQKIKIRLLKTGETQTVSEPESLKGKSVDWRIASWFPDGTRFLINASRSKAVGWGPPGSTRFIPPVGPVAQESSIWSVPLLSGVPGKLRDDAEAYSVSPDGSLVAFGTNPGELGYREIWLMDANGRQERKLYEADQKSAIGGLKWSPNGRRAIYFRFNDSQGALISRDLLGGSPTTLVSFSHPEDLSDSNWSSDGKLIYALADNPSHFSCNFWELAVNLNTGQPIGKPRRVSNWSGSCIGQTSMTADGKRLAFHRWARQTTIYVANAPGNGAVASSMRRLTRSEYINAAETWTPDGKALLFRSHRGGHLRIFRQALDSDTEEPLVMGVENVGGTSISPDGSWLFYLDCGKELDCDLPPTAVMGIPIAGGTPHLVLRSNTYGRPRCAISPATLCAIAESSDDGKSLIFTAFDALKGRGQELTRFETEPAASYGWGLSLDGSSIAVLKAGDRRIHTLSLTGQPLREIEVKGWDHLVGVYWASDGKGWFTCALQPTGSVLLHVDLQGKANPLWEQEGNSVSYGLPSPDGRHLAIVGTTKSNNVWMLENF